eukprot:TRINITY_DN8297_c0_g1_i1.p1 TRINITY_DN8297_c0_g1~~TRINITY_DN8297_c0_g1_i1.p1  ORF type:complete len:377 (+),score=73.84 TRINITY_DN8297_c0_g1_i1:401-1531(+)
MVVPSLLAAPFLAVDVVEELLRRLLVHSASEEETETVTTMLNQVLAPLEDRVASILGGDEDEEEGDKGAGGKYVPTVVQSKQSDFAMQAAQNRILNTSRVLSDSLSQTDHSHPALEVVMASLHVPPAEKVEGTGFEITETLVGEGSFGRVYLCSGPHNQKLAAKVINLKGADMCKIVGEISALMACQGCDQVLDIRQSYYTATPEPGTVTLISTLCDRELYDEVVSKAPFANATARHLFVQLIKGLSHIHSCGFCHRDIKLENLLLLDGNLKIADFGFAVAWCDEEGLVIPHRRKCGSVAYIAPEAYDGQNYDGRTLDVWSAGVILYVLVCAAFPFEQPSDRCGYYAQHLKSRTHFANEDIPVSYTHLTLPTKRIV